MPTTQTEVTAVELERQLQDEHQKLSEQLTAVSQQYVTLEGRAVAGENVDHLELARLVIERDVGAKRLQRVQYELSAAQDAANRERLEKFLAEADRTIGQLDQRAEQELANVKSALDEFLSCVNARNAHAMQARSQISAVGGTIGPKFQHASAAGALAGAVSKTFDTLGARQLADTCHIAFTASDYLKQRK